MTYSLIGEPPSSTGAIQVNAIEVVVTSVTVISVGGSGLVKRIAAPPSADVVEPISFVAVTVAVTAEPQSIEWGSEFRVVVGMLQVSTESAMQ